VVTGSQAGEFFACVRYYLCEGSGGSIVVSAVTRDSVWSASKAINRIRSTASAPAGVGDQAENKTPIPVERGHFERRFTISPFAVCASVATYCANCGHMKKDTWDELRNAVLALDPDTSGASLFCLSAGTVALPAPRNLRKKADADANSKKHDGCEPGSRRQMKTRLVDLRKAGIQSADISGALV